MKRSEEKWLCIKDCDVEMSAGGTHSHYFAGEIVGETQSPNISCFLPLTTEQAKQLENILKNIAKEKAYQEKQHLAIRNSHPRPNWKAEQRLCGSLQEARSMRARFNKIASEIAGTEIEVFWDCKPSGQISW